MFGLIDGTHVKVVVPAEKRARFYDRKSNISLNIQAVVGPDMRFIDFVNRWPGSTHDSRIFHSSKLYSLLESDPPEGHMLADAGYTNYSYMLTPLRKQPVLPAEIAYQKAHIKTRNLIERTFGAWKSKFQCLRGLRLKLSNSLHVISACAVLWNFLLAEREDPDEPFVQDEYATSTNSINSLPSFPSSQSKAEGDRKRLFLINSYFAQLSAPSSSSH